MIKKEKSRFWSRHILLSILPLLLLASVGFGQGERGAITGTVTDQTGAVVPETEITVTNVATDVNFTAMSTGSGTYRVPALPPGNYSDRH